MAPLFISKGAIAFHFQRPLTVASIQKVALLLNYIITYISSDYTAISIDSPTDRKNRKPPACKKNYL